VTTPLKDDPTEFLLRVQLATTSATRAYDSAIVSATMAQADSDRANRLAARECKVCFYLRGARFTGQAFTDWTCAACGKKDMHANTGVPRYCNDCADGYGLCVECGADVELKTRRKLERKR
jgi:hypothetical protein